MSTFEDFNFENEDKKSYNNNKKDYRSGKYNKYNNNGYNKSFNKNKTNKYPNIKGSYKTDIWNNDKFFVKTEEYNPGDDSNKKIVTFVNHLKDANIDTKDKENILEIFTKLAEDGYKARIICDYAQPITKDIIRIFGKSNVYFLTPWKSYCKILDKDVTMYLPTDKNIALAANYFKNYHKLPGAIKALNATVVATLVGLYNNEPSAFVLTYDPYYKGREIDFKNSKDASNYYILCKKFSISLFNLAVKNDVDSLNKIID